MATQKATNKTAAKAAAVSWTDHAWDEYLAWQKENQKIVQRINSLIQECQRDPFKGTGKPEPLKGNLSGLWSRRIDQEHRLVYLCEDGCVYIVQCRYHY